MPIVLWSGLAVTALPWLAAGWVWLLFLGDHQPHGRWGDAATSLFFAGIPLTILGLTLVLIGLVKLGPLPATDGQGHDEA